MTVCSICGGSNFSSNKVLWPRLIAEWQLAEHEVAYVDEQQGRACGDCGANLRVSALGHAIREALGTDLAIRAFANSSSAQNLRVLDVNGAVAISSALAQLPGYVRADFPVVDVHALPYENEAFDLIIHSDTLEHVEQPVRALEECRRVLAVGRPLCFTIPVIVGRLTRSRAGLQPSYHGDPATSKEDYLVRTEFGADAWTYLMQAGFSRVAIHQVEYPAALAFTAWCDNRPTVPAEPAIAEQSSNATEPMPEIYDQDGLRSHHNHEFMVDPDFVRAYARGVEAVGTDYRWHWRVHVGLWAARSASKLAGDFVECGVNRGFMSSAIMSLLNWDSTGRTFYLLDTFSGLDERYVSPDEKAEGIMERNTREIASGFYTFDVSAVRENFAEWSNVKIIAGPIPETLAEIDSHRVAFLHLDLNCSPPEVAAAETLWDRIVPGGFVLLDDYAYIGYRSQKLGMDAFAKRRNLEILSLPTGQGLLIKPAR